MCARVCALTYDLYILRTQHLYILRVSKIHTGMSYRTAIHGDNRVQRVLQTADVDKLVSEGKMVSLSDTIKLTNLVHSPDLSLCC